MQGYHGTGMAALMQAANVSKSSLYHHFPDGKEGIAMAALDRLSEQINDQLDQMSEDGVAGSVMMQSMIDRGVSMAGTSKALRGSLVAVLAWDCIPDCPKIAASVRQMIGQMLAQLQAGFEREGVANPASEARRALALVEGSMLLARIGLDRR